MKISTILSIAFLISTNPTLSMEKKDDFSCKACLFSTALCMGSTACSAWIAFNHEHSLRPSDGYTENERNQLMLNSTIGFLGAIFCCDELRKLYKRTHQAAPHSTKME